MLTAIFQLDSNLLLPPHAYLHNGYMVNNYKTERWSLVLGGGAVLEELCESTHHGYVSRLRLQAILSSRRCYNVMDKAPVPSDEDPNPVIFGCWIRYFFSSGSGSDLSQRIYNVISIFVIKHFIYENSDLYTIHKVRKHFLFMFFSLISYLPT